MKLNGTEREEFNKTLKRANVHATQKEMLEYAYSFSAGMGILDNYKQAYQCIVNTTELIIRF
jgi:hypothetical protein